jgi:hypothetical protein
MILWPMARPDLEDTRSTRKLLQRGAAPAPRAARESQRPAIRSVAPHQGSCVPTLRYAPVFICDDFGL